jgi:hypothetical protein
MVLAHASWIHGHSLHIEHNRFDLRYMGDRCRLSKFSTERFDDWVHFAIPTPVIVNDVRLKIDSVMLIFFTHNAIVNTVDVWDAGELVAHHDNLNMSGDHPFEWFGINIAPNHRVNLGIGVSVNVIHLGDATGIGPVPSVVDFRSAGGDFAL